MQSNHKIAVFDLDMFFCSCHLRSDPSLTDIPFVIGVPPTAGTSRRGVISASSYAARNRGIKAGVPAYKAQAMCKDLVFIRPNMELYRKVSREIEETIRRYLKGNAIIEKASIDEFYIDLTENTLFYGSATLTMQHLQKLIQEEHQITGSCGISINKTLAKIISNDNKPLGLTCIPTKEEALDYLSKLPLERIPGIGPKTLPKLHGAKLHKGADIQLIGLSTLQAIIGKKPGLSLYRKCLAISTTKINPDRKRKSIGAERTLTNDLLSSHDIKQVLTTDILTKVNARAANTGIEKSAIKGVVVKLKFNNFKTRTAQAKTEAISLDIIHPLVDRILSQEPNRPVRLVGIALLIDTQKEEQQLSLL